MTLAAMFGEIADALKPIAEEIDDLQVYDRWIDNPSPPCIDVYPGTPFQTGAAFGLENEVFVTVRARVGMADPDTAQSTLLRLLDTSDLASVEAALMEIDWGAVPDGVSGYVQYADDAPANERMLGCEWRVHKL